MFSNRHEIDPDRLLTSLLEAVRHFTPVRSKLVTVSDDSYALEQSDDGFHFDVSDSSAPFGDPDARYDFLDPVNSVVGEPLTRIRLTHTPGGSVLGISMSHAIGDGFSYFHFLSAWAQLYRGSEIIEPFTGREPLIPKTNIHAGPVTPIDVLSESGIFWDETRRAIARDRIRWDRFNITNAQQHKLLSDARTNSDARLSFNDVITAHLWREYIDKWDCDHLEKAAFVSCPVDVRRIIRGFPERQDKSS